MAKACIFCGSELSFFTQRTLICAGTDQPACSKCYNELVALDAEERGRRALDTGRAESPEVIRQYLDKQGERAKAERQSKLSGMTCLRCGSPMLKMGQQQFQLGEHSFFFGDMSHLMAGSMTLDIFQCENCRKVEFFAPEPPAAKKADSVPDIICPDCGASHSPHIGCPNCAMKAASFGSRPKSSPAKAKDPKVPWEK